jgi:hypothetical protein
MRELALDLLDKAVLAVAYRHIEESASKRVTGAAIWNDLSATGIAPVHIPARLRRFISHGWLQKDPRNSSNRYKVYAPTDHGWAVWHQIRLEA